MKEWLQEAVGKRGDASLTLDLVDEQAKGSLEAEAGRWRRKTWRRGRQDRIPRSIW